MNKIRTSLNTVAVAATAATLLASAARGSDTWPVLKAIRIATTLPAAS